MKTKFFWLTIFSGVILFGFGNALGCSCGYNGTPCGFYRAPGGVAFTGTVTDVIEADEKYGKKIGGKIRKITIRVDETFKGGLPGEVVTSDDGFGCDNYPFKLGESYLIFSKGVLENTQNILPVGLCSGTKLIEKATEDIGFLRQLKKGVMPNVLYGKLRRFVNDEKNPFVPLGKTKVILTKLYSIGNNQRVEPKKGEERIETTTDENGDFRFEKVSPAVYRLSADLPDDLWMPEVRELSAGSAPSCDYYPLSAYTNGSISGNVVNADGTPARISVHVRPIDKTDYYFQQYLWADENGNFTVPGLGEGRYRLYVSLAGYQLKDNSYPFRNFPFGNWFYPNNFEDNDAETIAVGYAQKITNINIKLPPFPTRKTVRGNAVWEDGKPAGSAIIVYKIKRSSVDYYQQSTAVKEDGSFELELFDNLEYEFSGYNASNEQPGLVDAVQFDLKAWRSSLMLIMKPRK